MTNTSVNDPCECGQTTIRGCADMPSRHCGAWEETAPPTFTAHELSALAEQGMTLTEAEEATVRESRGQTVKHVTDIIEKTVQHEQRVEKYWAEIERLRADNARLRDAIAPIAEKFLWPDDSYDPDAVRADPDWDEEANEGTADDVWITRGAIRRARTAMEASNGNQ